MTPAIRHPFRVVPWNRDFLKALLDMAVEECGGDLKRAVFLFPHARPKRYLALLLRDDPRLARPLIMPAMHTVGELFRTMAGRLHAQPAWSASRLDRVGLLLTCVREETGERPDTWDARRFFPWGLRLASLFEECFSQCRRPENFLHVDSVSPFAALLLERLGNIFARYERSLLERGWTTPGHEAFTVAEFLARERRLPPGRLPGHADSRPVYIAGFHLLTGAENALFRLLWEEHGARVA
ncbi:MAG: PD-(D/E)XK nuclease family protein, partial [Desulfovibrio sp.]|nr:PD-(D/E)XK nuclease family protein [Desulfovibrio sp.]